MFTLGDEGKERPATHLTALQKKSPTKNFWTKIGTDQRDWSLLGTRTRNGDEKESIQGSGSGVQEEGRGTLTYFSCEGKPKSTRKEEEKAGNMRKETKR